uniref:Alpha-1,3-mannosyl-glycoprotein 2-beta-N-acetylglucosaminyltransferase n=1 Tax=Hirondellea gigas TaxID=1518452 RepID=A0A6A7FVQ5_9CRUS
MRNSRRNWVFCSGITFFSCIVLFNVRSIGLLLETAQTSSEVHTKDTEISSLLNQLRVQVELNNDHLKKIKDYQHIESNLQAQVVALKEEIDESNSRIAAIKNSASKIVGTDVVDPDDPGIIKKLAEEIRHVGGVNSISVEAAPMGIPVIVMCFTRAAELNQTLSGIFAVKPPTGFPVYISQDGTNEAVTAVIEQYVAAYPESVFHLRFAYTGARNLEKKNMEIYHRIAAHYGWMLAKVFDELHYPLALILEDDMSISPDFFDYFYVLSKTLEQDSTIFCVSAWNDNGLGQFVADPLQLLRTDVFPGLGWMLTKNLWLELKKKWPSGFWDDWLRQDEQTRNRTCIFPEVNRVYTFGRHGSSGGQHFDKYLKNIKLNTERVDFSSLDLAYIREPIYHQYLGDLLKNATTITLSDLNDLPVLKETDHNAFLLEYSNLNQFTTLANEIGLMTDHKNGIPRTSYDGIVQFRSNLNRIFLVPSKDSTN